jgi:SAM-dependent methyltransferase
VTQASDGSQAIYLRPEDYDLEHVNDEDDIRFFVDLATRFKPRRVLELASGTGRVTLPLAEAGVEHGFQVVGLELVPEMLRVAEERRAAAPPAVRESLDFARGDLRDWRADEPFDLILTPCGSVTHLLTLEDQLAAWTRARANLAPGGRFVVDVPAPDHGAYADSFRRPPREILEVDLDTRDDATDTRLIRYRSTRYHAHEQRAQVRFLYDKFVGDAPPERSVSDYESHVYYPRELHLLYRHTGFAVEETYGDYQGHPPRHSSRVLVYVGRKTGD